MGQDLIYSRLMIEHAHSALTSFLMRYRCAL